MLKCPTCNQPASKLLFGLRLLILALAVTLLLVIGTPKQGHRKPPLMIERPIVGKVI